MRGKLIHCHHFTHGLRLFVEIHSARMVSIPSTAAKLLLAPADFRIQDHIVPEWE